RSAGPVPARTGTYALSLHALFRSKLSIQVRFLSGAPLIKPVFKLVWCCGNPLGQVTRLLAPSLSTCGRFLVHSNGSSNHSYCRTAHMGRFHIPIFHHCTNLHQARATHVVALPYLPDMLALGG